MLVEAVSPSQMLAQNPSGPLPEAGRTCGIDAVADRDNGIQIVMLQQAFDLSFAFESNYREILGSCHFVQFSIPEDVFQVKADAVRGRGEQFCHLALTQPYSLTLQPYLDKVLFALEDDDV